MAILLVLAGSAVAAPVYLDCVTKFDKPTPDAAKEFRFSVKIDEASGAITHTDADGSAFNVTGFFSSGEVAYKHQDENSDTFVITTAYQINRSDLSVMRTFTGELSENGMEKLHDWSDSKHISITKGTCKIVDTKNRKF
ncbi:MAG: hypothetical protein ACXWIJ_12535 [Burkholderiales bacterium]